MANYFPLIVNAGNSTIDELPAGDNLNLASSDIVNAGNITANYFYGNGAGLTGIIVSAGNGIVNGICFSCCNGFGFNFGSKIKSIL